MDDIINSFINGQRKQMLEQIRDNYQHISDFVQELEDSELLNDKQKITILGRVVVYL